MMPPSIQQKLAIDQELLTAVRLIQAGLGQLQKLDGANDFYHLPLLTLSSGFERLMKVILCLRILEKTGEFPGPKDIPSGRIGHDLELLLQRIREECFLAQYVDKIPIAKEDLEYLESEELLSFLAVLGKFGQAARYYHVDVVLGRQLKTDEPGREWESLETAILTERPDLMKEIEEFPASERIYQEIAVEVVSRLERFARALARLFTIGGIGQEAKRYVGYLSKFLYIRDESLGENEYSPLGADTTRWPFGAKRLTASGFSRQRVPASKIALPLAADPRRLAP
jgi:hypothetical protein